MSRDQTALDKVENEPSNDKPDFGVLANAIHMDPNSETIEIEDFGALLPDGEAGKRISALIASDIELVFSE